MSSSRGIAQAAVMWMFLLTPQLTGAQQSADAATQCIPKKKLALPPFQQVAVDMFASLVPARDSADASAMYLATLLQEVQLAFTPPTVIALLADGAMRVWLHADGRLTGTSTVDTLLPPEVAHALAVAIDSVSRRGGIGSVIPPLRSDSVELRLIVQYPEERASLSVPLMRVALAPAYLESQVDKPAIQKPGGPAPRYPQVLREGGVEGEVLVQFIVDRMGQAEMRTFKVLRSSHREFTQAARAVVPRMSFYPAELGGCTVRQVVQLPIAWRLGH